MPGSREQKMMVQCQHLHDLEFFFCPDEMQEKKKTSSAVEKMRSAVGISQWVQMG